MLHLCGPGNFNASLEGTKYYAQCEYLDEDMADAYACADMLVSRAGANTLCEIVALHKPALLIPYPKGASRGDQIINAQSFVDRGLAHQLLQENLNGKTLYDAIIKLYTERGALYEKMDREPSANGLETCSPRFIRPRNIDAEVTIGHTEADSQEFHLHGARRRAVLCRAVVHPE